MNSTETPNEPSPETPSEPHGPSLGTLWLPILVAAAFVVAAFAIRAELRSQEEYHVYLLTQSEGGRLRNELTIKLDERRDALTRFASEWATEERPSESDWRVGVDRLLARELQYRAIEWREPTLDVRWQAPIGSRLEDAVLDPRDDELRFSAMRAVEELSSTAVPASFSLHDGTRQLIVSAPMTAGTERAGFMVGVMRVRDLIDGVVHDAVSRGFEVSAYEGPFLLFGPNWELSGENGQYVQDAVVHWAGLSLTFKVWPSEGALKQLRSPLLNGLIWIGLVVGLAFAWLIYRMDAWRHRAHHGWTPSDEHHDEMPNAAGADSEPAEVRESSAP